MASLDKFPYSIKDILACENDQKFFEKFPIFDNNIFRLALPINKRVAICIIILLYSKNHSLYLEYQEARTAKLKACELLNIPVVSKKIVDESINNLLFGKHRIFTQMIIQYLRIQKSIEFSELCIYVESFYNQLQKLSLEDDDNGEKIKDIRLNVKGLKDEINSLMAKYSNNDKSLSESILEDVENERLELKPEDIALKLQQEEPPLGEFNPYGKSYKFPKFPGQLKFNPYNNK